MPAPTPAYAVIVAGGSGSRMGTALPKQFIDLCGKPVLYWSLKAFLDALPGLHIILVLPEEWMAPGQSLLESFPAGAGISIVAGGATRYASVAAGMKQVPPDAIVFVHDGARPLLSEALIRRCYEGALTNGSAVPVIPVADSVRQVMGAGSRAIMREELRIVQTPQTFRAGLLQQAFLEPYKPMFTDEASVVEWQGSPVHLVDGERSNLKITTPEDLVIAEALLRLRERI